MITLTRSSNRGFTLVEVMVAVVVLAIGLLGMATLMMNSLQSSESAYSRSQASLLAYDIIDRMRANKVLDPSNPYQSFRVTHASLSNDYALANPGACPAANAGNANGSGATKATADLSQWCAQLRTNMPNLLAGTSISRNGSIYTVDIRWQEAHDSDNDGNPDIGTLVVEAEL